jgi:glycosyltransferase involved in cell wall biosynthesis
MKEVYLSVIIPCFNGGAYLMEAIESVQTSVGDIMHEIIIVNDGSTDHETIELLNKINIQNVVIVHQENKGPAAARNTGIKKSKGEFLLFLDSDNKIRENYFTKGLSILTENKEIGVVYGNPHFFGEDVRPRFKPEKFDKFKILKYNYIDMCALMKRAVWIEEGEFDEEASIIGYEDWEYWIRLSNTKWKLYFLDEICFDYRLRSNSLVMTFEPEKIKRMRDYILLKHFYKIVDTYHILYNLREYESNRPFRTFTKNVLRKVKGQIR